MTQTAKVKAAVGMIKAVADAIKELGRVPSGSLYATLMNHLTIDQYNQIVSVLKNAGLVKDVYGELVWQAN